MKKSLLRVIMAISVASLAATAFTGCNKKEVKPTVNDPVAEASKINPISLTYWAVYSSDQYKNRGETPLYKELEKRTGVKVTWLHPPKGQESEQFKLLVSSGDLPDVIEYSLFNYNGGPQKAIDDGIVVPMNDLMDKYMPNLKKLLKDNPTVDKEVKTDAGKYFCAPNLQIDPALSGTQGWLMRKDWLDECNLQPPTTMDEWYTALKAFRDKKGSAAPLSAPISNLTGSRFTGAYGIGDRAFYLTSQGDIKYGAVESAYKDLLKTLNTWYAEGLIDPDFKADESEITSGKIGAFNHSLMGGMGKFLDATKATNPKFDLVGIGEPSLKKGEIPEYGSKLVDYKSTYDAAITTSNKHPEDTAKWLDYGYSKEGHLLFNFGVEGQTYTMVNGKPKYTDVIMKAPEGAQTAMGNYTRANGGGPFDQDAGYLPQYWTYPEKMAAAQKAWMNAKNIQGLPKLNFAAEDNAKMTQILGDINTYVDTMVKKFIVGEEPISNFDSFVKTINNMGLPEALQIEKAAYEKFKKR